MAKQYVRLSRPTRQGFYVYRITCRVTGKAYIGQTMQAVEERFAQHLRCADADQPDKRRDQMTRLCVAMREHGTWNFEVEHIASANCRADLLALETLLIEQHDTLEPNGYNYLPGGRVGKPDTAEVRERKRIAQKAYCAGHARAPLSEEARRKISAGSRNAMTDERRRAVGDFFRGRKQSPETVAKRVAAITGRKKSPEHIEKMRAARLGVTHSPETRAKISASLKARAHNFQITHDVTGD